MSSHNIKTEVQLSEILQSVGAEHLEVGQWKFLPVEGSDIAGATEKSFKNEHITL